MTPIHPGTPPVVPGGAPAARIVQITGREERDPDESWERPASEQDLKELSTRRFERLPHRPASPAEIPAGALDALRPVVGDVGLERMFVIPRSVRMAGAEEAHWVLSPTEVLAAGTDRLAVWLDDPDGPRVRATMSFDEVVALLDRTVLLSGRLELVGREASVIVRYNTVGRPDVRALLQSVRATADPMDPAPPAAGRDPESLPHKWRALTRSSDVSALADGPMAIAAGDLDNPEPLLHNGVAVLTSRELVIATDPTPDVQMAQYGFDLVVVPRQRLLSIDGSESTLVVTADASPGRVELRVAAHPSLVAETVELLAPLAARAG